jgi:hypothetical protein
MDSRATTSNVTVQGLAGGAGCYRGERSRLAEVGHHRCACRHQMSRCRLQALPCSGALPVPADQQGGQGAHHRQRHQDSSNCAGDDPYA